MVRNNLNCDNDFGNMYVAHFSSVDFAILINSNHLFCFNMGLTFAFCAGVFPFSAHVWSYKVRL